MKNHILIEKATLEQQVNLKNHYMGESLKRKDINADIMQSSSDDYELFNMFMSTACNELISTVAMRFSQIEYQIEKDFISITFTCNKKATPSLLSILKQSITDYLVNEMILQWLILRRPEMAHNHISLRIGLYNNVQQQFAKFCRNTGRRRATDLAGI